jgi:nucleotide-binding universal stress UspA family protein
MNTILLATDGSPSAQTATSTAIELAAETGWRLKVLSVWSVRTLLLGPFPPDLWKQIEDAEREQAQNVVEETIAAAKAQGIDAEGAVGQGDAAAVICEAAHDATLVVIGAHGWGSVKRLVFGSVSSSVLHHAPCPVLVVRADLPDAPEASRLAERDRLADAAL